MTATPRATRARKGARAPKSESIDVRVASATKAILTMAAQVRHTTLSEFVLSSAVREAERALSDRRVFPLAEKDWDAFMEALNAPAVADADLVDLAKSKAPWDG